MDDLIKEKKRLEEKYNVKVEFSSNVDLFKACKHKRLHTDHGCLDCGERSFVKIKLDLDS